MSEEKQVEMTKEDGLYLLRIKGDTGIAGIGNSESAAIDYALRVINFCIAESVRKQAAILEYKKQSEVKA